uniref:G_PROTEIN_RECEP_F1_2 domain-containing protein n=1 Tax=Heterorhabditis bacteriophora TaxID=37862 RepID=A0A1I7X980_HETBA
MVASEEAIRSYVSLIGGSYVTFGLLGFVCNVATVVMICTNRVYRLSAYTLMANVALADSITMLMAGVACGCDILWPDSVYPISNEKIHVLRGAQVYSDENLLISYAMLGLNRCIAICYYGTKAKSLNRVSIAVFSSLTTWLIGIVAAIVGTIPEPLIGIRRDMWTISFITTDGERPTLFIVLVCLINFFGVAAQWLCSTLVLLKIRQVKQKISRNKLNQNSANRFRKQARLTFQFFYPSVLCTLSTFIYFIKPYAYHFLSPWQMVLLHMILLCNHTCNPFIYAYFNDRMRMTYKEMLTCSAIRYEIRKRRTSHPFHNTRHNISR